MSIKIIKDIFKVLSNFFTSYNHIKKIENIPWITIRTLLFGRKIVKLSLLV